ncbi:nrgA [Symbiodinium microadriaticum]|nr:nrgA [Symbiodinium microadriaticum]
MGLPGLLSLLDGSSVAGRRSKLTEQAEEMEGLSNGDTAWMATSCALVLFMTPGLLQCRQSLPAYLLLLYWKNMEDTWEQIPALPLTTYGYRLCPRYRYKQDLAGLAFFYGGLVRDTNIVNTMMMSIISMGLTTITWLVFGFSWSFDEWGAGKGFTYVGFRNLDMVWPGTTMPGLTFAVFQMTFAIIAAAIISGAVVERIRFSAYAIFIVAWVLAVYVPLCHWIWGGGWIAEMGTKDFAGGTVVHISSGTSAFALASLLGARKERAESFPANLPFVILGGGILWLGWTATVAWLSLAGRAAVFNSARACRVNITPCAGFVEPLGALGVGAIGALCCVFAARGLKKLNLVDDSLDCFSLHGVGGFAGAILGGFFDLGDGLIYGGDGLLLAKNLAGAAFGVVYSAAATAVIFGLMRVVMRMRVSEEQELEGVDINCHSEAAYGKTEGFGEHSHRMTPETAVMLYRSVTGQFAARNAAAAGCPAQGD